MPTVALPSISAAIFSTALESTLRKRSLALIKNGVKKIVVACRDFTSPGIVLQDFASLKNTVIDSGHSGYGTELSDIMRAMEDQTAFPPVLLQQHLGNYSLWTRWSEIGIGTTETRVFYIISRQTKLPLPLCMTAGAACIPRLMKPSCETP